MADQQYIVNFTDADNGSFNIAPYTMNGPESPRAPLPLAPSATLASTSLALPGKGITSYGEYVAENLVHLLENFSNGTAPAYSIEGQLWYNNTTGDIAVYDGAVYHILPRADGATFTSDVDMSGYAVLNLANAVNPTDALNMQTGDTRYVNVIGDTMTGVLAMGANKITNLADATVATDALNMQTGDARYVNIAGDTMTGVLAMGANKITNLADATVAADALNLQTGDARYVAVAGDTMAGMLTLFADPALPMQAATKQYVDGVVGSAVSSSTLAGLSDVTISIPVIGNSLYFNGTEWVNYTIPTPYVPLAGGVMTGALTLVGAPTSPDEAATKQYVDDEIAAVSGGVTTLDALTDVTTTGAVSGEVLTFDGVQWINSPLAAPTSDIYVSAGAVVGLGYGTLTLTQTGGGPTISVPGIATTTHTHTTEQSYHDANPTNDSSYIRDRAIQQSAYPQNIPLSTSLTLLDEAVAVLRSVPARTIIEADGTVGPFQVPDYVSATGRLEVFVNGIKSYADTRGTASIFIDGGPVASPTANGGTDTTLVGGTTYDMRLWSDSFGSLVTLNITPTNTTISLAVAGANSTTDQFTVVGNYVTTFMPGNTFTISNSTIHNGTYTVASTTYTGSTTGINVVEPVAGNIADGNISVTQVTFHNLVAEINDAIGVTALADNVVTVFQDGSISFISTSQGDLSRVVVYDGTGANPLLAALTTTFTASVVEYNGPGGQVPIYQANATTDVFTVPGDRAVHFPTNTRFAVTGSVGNDTQYQVIAPGAVYAAGYTTIPVTATTIVTNETAGNGTGSISISRTLGYSERDILGFQAPALEVSDAIQFNSAPPVGALIEVIAHR